MLDNLAAAGGTTHRYQADSVADLQTILDTLIKVQIKPCIFPLARIPEHPDDLEVVLTDTQGDVNTILKRGTQWDYVTTGADTDGVEIDGANCTLIQTSSNGRYKLSFLLVTPI